MEPNANEYKFSDIEMEAIREFEDARRQIDAQIQGALRMIAKTHKLVGQWEFAGDKFVKKEDRCTHF